MTVDEITKVARIATTADGGCGFCVTELMDKLCEAFPEHADAINLVRHDEGLDDRMEAAMDAWQEAGYQDGKEPKIWTVA